MKKNVLATLIMGVLAIGASPLGRICNPTTMSMSICNAETKADYKSLY